MLATVEGSARALIEKYRLRAVFIAIERLNRSIDKRDWRARDFWAQVVHAIHEHQRSGEVPAGGSWSVTAASDPRGGSAQKSERSTD
jgi:hypothetical protein